MIENPGQYWYGRVVKAKLTREPDQVRLGHIKGFS